MNKIELRRQCERILFDIIYDEDVLQRVGTFTQMPIGEFSRAHGWRNYQVKEALKDLARLNYLTGLQFEPKRASFHIRVPTPFQQN